MKVGVTGGATKRPTVPCKDGVTETSKLKTDLSRIKSIGILNEGVTCVQGRVHIEVVLRTRTVIF